MPKPSTFWGAIGVLCAVGAVIAATSIVRAHSFCPVHGGRLVRGTAPMEYGKMSGIFLAGPDRMQFFPRSESFIEGGCGVGRDGWHQVWYCQSCREAEAAWMVARGYWLNEVQRDAAK